MPVKYYDWGVLKGGANSDGSAITPAEAPFGVPEPFSGTTNGATVTTITFSSPTKRIRLANVDDRYSLQYSFDNVEWYTLLPYQIIQESVRINEIYLQSYTAGTTPAYELVGIE